MGAYVSGGKPADKRGGSRVTRGRREGRGEAVLFAVLLAACYGLICAVIAAAYYMVSPRLGVWHPYAVRAAATTLAALAALGAVAFIALVHTARRGRDFLPFLPCSFRQAVLLSVYPVCEKLGRLAGLSRDRVSAAFIDFNNRLVLARARRLHESGLLVLLPRCLQDARCPQRILEDVGNCARCGTCDISRLVELMERHRFPMAVATGGRLARSLVRRFSPSAVIAIACERELLDGLRAISPIPVVGIVNKRPEGPCRNTRVDLSVFEDVVKSLIARRE